MVSESGPSTEVLAAFGLEGEAHRMPGGQNSSWIIDFTILKFWEDDDSEFIEWQTQIQAQLFQHQSETANCAFRIPEPVRAQNGAYFYKGWTAARLIDGVEYLDLEGHLDEILSASRAMHDVLGKIVSKQHPALLRRYDRWACADRIAWNEVTFADTPKANAEMFNRLKIYIDKLEAWRRPLRTGEAVNQLIHSDLSGNILFSPTGDYTPGIIDFTPLWRPVEYAEAIVTADALTWRRSGKEFVERIGLTEYRFQMLIRALLFRVLTYTIDVNEDFIKQNLGSMDLDHAMVVMDSCAAELKLQEPKP